MIGDKRHTEALESILVRQKWIGRGAFLMHRSARETERGVLRSEDADMSSDKTG